ncbi:hypothetical protein [Corallococcus terminator]|uniref:hypothetical protein n=1 Tax=Corallococcus terminator TaxID=2316733 RepID=UPI0011C3F35F|nr:hypothetical protein [Corallococcus terminator]
MLLVFLVPATAAACSCEPTRNILELELADAQTIIFIGAVDAGDGGARRERFFIRERLLRVRPFLFLRGSWPERPVELWASTVESSSDCGAHLQTGWTYLLVARRTDDGKLGAGPCSMTAPLFVYGVLIGLLATLLLVAGAIVWGLWRWLRRVLSPQGPAEVGRHVTAWTRSPGAWLFASGGLLAMAVLLWNLAPHLSRPGTSERWAEPYEPDLRMFALALGILACISGALATLCCATWVALQTWRRTRSYARPTAS